MSRHVAVPASPGVAADGAIERRDGQTGSSGGAEPRGMWWVAWRQHRFQIAVTLGILAVIAVALVVFREVAVARLTAAGCSLSSDLVTAATPQVCGSIWPRDFDNWQRILHMVVIAAPVVLGVFVGAPLFPREFEHGTHVLALTQSVGRIRWWAVKVAVAAVPLVLGLAGIGFLLQWVDASYWMTDRAALDGWNFTARGFMPAVFGALSVAIAVTAGIVTRTTVAAIVTGLVVAGVALIGVGFLLKPHLMPATRTAAPVEAEFVGGFSYGPMNPNDLFLRQGYLTSTGTEVDFTMNTCYLEWDATHPDSSDPSNPEWGRAMVECAHRHGAATEFTDYMPGSALWPLRGIVTAICALLAAAFLTVGARRLRPALGRR